MRLRRGETNETLKRGAETKGKLIFTDELGDLIQCMTQFDDFYQDQERQLGQARLWPSSTFKSNTSRALYGEKFGG